MIAIETSVRFPLSETPPINGDDDLDGNVLYQMQKKANPGCYLEPMPADMVFCRDDAASFMSATPGQVGKDRGTNGQWWIGNTKHQKASNNFAYKKDPGDKDPAFVGGTKVSGAYISNAAGKSGPIMQFVAVPAKCMRHPIEVFESKALTVNDQDPDHEGKGYIMFISDSCDGPYDGKVAASIWMFENVEVPFVNAVRKKKWGHRPGDPVPDHMAAELQLDGCNEQITMCKHPKVQQLCKDHKIVLRKGNPSRTGCEQATDLAVGNKQTKQCTKIDWLPEDVDAGVGSLFRKHVLLHAGLKHLPANTKKALFRLVSILPAVHRKAQSSSKVKNGHIRAGNRTGTSQWPSHQKMLETRTVMYTTAEMELVSPDVIGGEPLEAANTQGEILEDIWERLGRPVDADLDGIPKPRTNTGNERSMRVLVFTHPSREQKRLAAMDLQDQVAIDKWKAACQDVDGQLSDSASGEEMCKAITGKSPTTQAETDTMMRQLTPEQAKNGKKSAGKGQKGVKLKKDTVLQHVAARTCPDISKMPKGFLTKHRLSSDDPNAQTALTMLRAVAGEPVVAARPPKPAPRSRAQTAAPLEEVVVASVASSSAGAASSVLGDATWRANAAAAFSGVDLSTPPDGKMLARADALAAAMRSRLPVHLQTRVKDKKMREHNSFKWFSEQIPRLAALITLAGHAVRRPGACSAAESLLVNFRGDTRPKSVRNRLVGGRCGVCLWVGMDGNVVGSGKAAGAGGFLARDDEHTKCARNVNAGSARNYRTYPSERSRREADTYFEDLQRVVAIGINPVDRDTPGLLCADEVGSVFSWGEHLQQTKKAGFAGDQGEHGHQVQFVACALELACDLMIAPHKNASDSPGFELPIGFHVKGRSEGGVASGAAR